MEFYKNFYRNKSENKGYVFKFTHERSLENISNELLICIATVGLMAIVADGNADTREVDCFMKSFRRNFLITRSSSSKIINYALKRILNSEQGKLLQYSCEQINLHMNTDQKVVLLDIISDILVSDGKTTEGEEYYLCFLINQLNLVGELENALDQCQIGPINKTLNPESKRQLLNGVKNYTP